MSATILEYWRRITFDFSGKEGSITGVFDVKVDSTGVPITEKGSCIWEEVSGAKIGGCTYDEYNDVLNIESEYNIFLSDFSVASENTTYTESDPTGTWSYVNANVEGFTITASASNGSTISPSGNVTVLSGADQSFIIEATGGYQLASVLVDNVEAIGQVVKNIYTFSNVQSDHTISVSATALQAYTITSTAGVGGTISPSGTSTVYEGGSKTYSISASTGFDINDVLVDSTSVGTVSSYTFSNVQADHTISASFNPVQVIKTYRVITFNFTGKGTYAGIFQIAVDANGIPDTTDFESISGDSVIKVGYGSSNGIILYIEGSGEGQGGMFSNFSTAVPNQTYTEQDPAGTWSYTLGSTTTTYTIVPSASSGGSISPNTPQIVEAGDDETFTISPSEGYKITSVLVDGVSVGKVTTYTFTNVNAVHTISASFEELGTYDIEIEMDLTGKEFDDEWVKFIAAIVSSGSLSIVSNTYDNLTGTGTITITETDTLPDNVFQSQTHITSVVLPECFTTIDDGAFAGCTSLRTITFPSTVTNFGTLVFTGCTSLGKIIMNSPTPPTIEGNDLGVDNVEVDVPAGSGSAYANALGWSDQEIVDPTPEPVYGFNLDKMVDTDYLMQGIMKK